MSYGYNFFPKDTVFENVTFQLSVSKTPINQSHIMITGQRWKRETRPDPKNQRIVAETWRHSGSISNSHILYYPLKSYFDSKTEMHIETESLWSLIMIVNYFSCRLTKDRSPRIFRSKRSWFSLSARRWCPSWWPRTFRFCSLSSRTSSLVSHTQGKKNFKLFLNFLHN